MNLQEECTNLVNTELDVFGRQPQLEVATFAAWQTMQAAAIKDDIVLQIISAYRSFDYQKQMFIRKMARGDSLSAILQVNAAPGYSEHHSGRAVDIGCPGYPFLEVNLKPALLLHGFQFAQKSSDFICLFPKKILLVCAMNLGTGVSSSRIKIYGTKQQIGSQIFMTNSKKYQQ